MADPNIRRQAEDKLKSAEDGNLAQFMLALVGELSSASKAVIVRQLAGLHLKNLLSAKDSTTLAMKRSRWQSNIPSDIKVQIRSGVANVLRDGDATARHTAAQVVAEIGAIDLPSNDWPDLMNTLLQNVTDVNSPEGVKISSLESLGYMSELMEEVELDQNVTNQILTAIVDGIKDVSERASVSMCASLTIKLTFLLRTSHLPHLPLHFPV